MATHAVRMMLLLTASFLAGCAGETEEEPAALPCADCPADPCPDATTASTVAGFTAYGGTWSIGEDEMLCGEGTGAVNSLVSNTDSGLSDLEASLDFRMLERRADEYDAGAGMVIHFQDADNFQIIRYSPREQGWHLFTMTGGERAKQNNATVPGGTHPAFGEWVTLRVTSTAGHVTAFHGATQVIDYQLPAGAATEGGVGYFLRAEQAAQFEDLSAVGI